MNVADFFRSKQSAELLEPQAYLSGLQVSSAQAAALLGISVARWGQLVTAHQDLEHAAVTTPGVRGARWPLRSILEFALRENRAVKTRIPALLPNPSGPRYVAASTRLPESPKSMFTSYLAYGGVEEQVKVEFFAPAQRSANGIDHPAVALVTPVWPSEVVVGIERLSQRLLHPDNPWFPILEGFLDDSAKHDDTAIALVLIPTAGRTENVSLLDEVEVLEFSVNDILSDRPRRPRKLKVPAKDVAACLGWKALPIWPSSTNTKTNLSAWSPDQTIEGVLPADWGELWGAAQWIASTEPSDALYASKQAVLHTIHHSIVSDLGHAKGSPSEGFRLGAQPAAPGAPSFPGQLPSFTDATDWAFNEASAPYFVTEPLFNYFGDSTFIRAAAICLDTLPPEWSYAVDKLQLSAEPSTNAVPGSQRRRRLETAIYTLDPTAQEISHYSMGPLAAPAALSHNVIAWCAPTAIPTVEEHQQSSASAKSDFRSILFVRTHDAQTVAIAMSVAGELVPLPWGSPGWYGEGALYKALRLAVMPEKYTSTEQLWQHEKQPTQFRNLLDAVTPQEPIVVDWLMLKSLVLGDRQLNGD